VPLPFIRRSGRLSKDPFSTEERTLHVGQMRALENTHVAISHGKEASALLGSVVVPNGPIFSGISNDEIANLSTQFGYAWPEDQDTVISHLQSLEISWSLQ